MKTMGHIFKLCVEYYHQEVQKQRTGNEWNASALGLG